jgi:hypothetical protein
MESVECARIDGRLRWIKFEHYTRYHAIYASHWGLHWTYCGRSIRPEGVRDEKGKPPARCGCCRSRVNQAMLPLLREAPATRIVKVSSGAGSLTINADPAYAHRSVFGPVYPASKTALNAMTLAMANRRPPIRCLGATNRIGG